MFVELSSHLQAVNAVMVKGNDFVNSAAMTTVSKAGFEDDVLADFQFLRRCYLMSFDYLSGFGLLDRHCLILAVIWFLFLPIHHFERLVPLADRNIEIEVGIKVVDHAVAVVITIGVDKLHYIGHHRFCLWNKAFLSIHVILVQVDMSFTFIHKDLIGCFH